MVSRLEGASRNTSLDLLGEIDSCLSQENYDEVFAEILTQFTDYIYRAFINWLLLFFVWIRTRFQWN